MICQRCSTPLTDETALPIDTDRPTGAGFTTYVCKELCTPAPTQTSPVSRPEPIREG